MADRMAGERVSITVKRVDVFDGELLASTLDSIGDVHDGVAVAALDHPAVREAINALAARGVTVVTLVSDVPGSKRMHYAGIDNSSAGRTAASLMGRFLRGMTGNLLNPKAAVFYVALLPTFMRPDHGSPLAQALTLGGLHLAVAVAIHSLIVLGAASAGGLVLKRMQGPAARALMAGGIALVAVWMAWETRA